MRCFVLRNVKTTARSLISARALVFTSLVVLPPLAWPQTGAPIWTNRFSSPGEADDIPDAVAVDKAGTVYVTGSSYGGTANGDDDFLTLAYPSTGLPLWTNRYHGPANRGNTPVGVALGPNGNVVVAGYVSATNRWYDYATIAYSTAGVPLWTSCYDGPAHRDDRAIAMAVAGDGTVFVTGYSCGTNGWDDYATVAYSAGGVPLWTNRYREPGDQFTYPAALAVDVSGNVFVTGYALANGAYEYATVAYSDAGMPLWTNRYNEDGYSSYATALAVDRAGNTVVTGYSDRLPVHGRDYLTIMYSSTVQVRLSVQREENHLVLRWPSQSLLLQCAPSITGLFTNIPGAASPYTNSISSAQQYFRLSSP